MAVERFGWFNADSQHADFLAAYDFDPAAYPHFPQLFTILQRLVVAESGGSYCYLIYADAETMASDEQDGRGRHSYYSISGDELKSEFSTELPEEELEAFTVLVRGLFKAVTSEEIAESELAKAVDEFRKLSRDADERSAAKADFAVGEPVHVSDPAGNSYRASSCHGFDPSLHDARKVLKDSVVDYTRGRGALDIYPLPPRLVKEHGKYWGEFKDKDLSKAYFMGNTKKDLEKKASIHLSWREKFGSAYSESIV